MLEACAEPAKQDALSAVLEDILKVRSYLLTWHNCYDSGPLCRVCDVGARQN